MSKIVPKTAQEIQIMRDGAVILKAAHNAARQLAVPGNTLLQLDTAAESVIRQAGAVPTFKGFHGFPASLCTMVNDQVVHGIPDGYVLQAGDLLSVDCGVTHQGLITDAAFSLVVGGPDANPQREAFHQCVYQALQAGCAAAKHGHHVGDIGHAIERVIRDGGYRLCREYTGHGVGRDMHEDPHIYNYGQPGQGPRLVSGMSICIEPIEPIVAAGKPRVRTLDDGWTVVTLDGSDGCQWEHCGIVTADGLDILV